MKTWEITIDYTPANAPDSWEASSTEDGESYIAWSATSADELLAAIARDLGAGAKR